MATLKQPAKIFKYMRMNEFTLKSLEMHELYFCRPKNLNDPYEFTAPFTTTLLELEQYRAAGKFRGILDIKHTNDLIKVFKQKPLEAQRTVESLNLGPRDTMAVCCFSASNANTLMYAHYSDSLKGICLEFDLAEDADFFKDLREVHYVKVAPLINLVSDHDIEKKLALTKAYRWKYEQEWRIVREGEGTVSYNPKALSGIIFGPYTDDKDIELIRRITTVTHVKLKRAKPTTNFTMDLAIEEV